MTSKEMIRKLKRAGWERVRASGSHQTFKHPGHPHLITVPVHAGDLKKGLEKAILKQAGLE